MPTFAAIDIGSNSCRMKIAKVAAHRLKTLVEDREVTRLGASVFESGLISPEAMAATLRALKRFQRAVQSHGVDRIRVVATAAMRDARNAAAFQAWVKAETGWNMEIISGLEEGRLIHLGVTGSEPGAGGRVLLIDLGGGSCELTLSEHKHIKETISLPLGAVRLTEQFLPTDPAPSDGLARMRQLIARDLRRAHRRLQLGRIPLVIGTSGTAAALSEACAPGIKIVKAGGKSAPRIVVRRTRVDRAQRSAVLAGMVSTKAVRKLAGKLAKMSLPEREAVPGIGPRRAEIIVAGAEVYAEILDSFGLHGFRYSPFGLRDGILAQMLAEQDARAKAHREFEHERWESVLATARRYGVDPRQSEPVRGSLPCSSSGVEKLRKSLSRPSMKAGLPRRQSCATPANLSTTRATTDTPSTSSPVRRSTGIRSQRTLVSAIARYLGKSRPQPGDRALRNIPADEHKNVHRAVVLLRLAVALNQDRASDVVRVGVRFYPKRVYLELRAGRTGAELELWSLRKEAGYFSEVFGRALFVELA